MPVCSRCGYVSQNNDRYCLSCGYPLNASDVATPVATPSQNGAVAADDTDWANATVMEQPAVNTPPTPAATATVVARLFIRPLSPEAGTESREYLLDGKPVAVGRSPSCEIVLEYDQLTSRRHAQLRFDGDHYSVVDLGSSNGTIVNENEIREATPLKDGDRIVIGEHEFLYTTPSAAHADHGATTPAMHGVSISEMTAAAPATDVPVDDVAEPAAASAQSEAGDIAAFETVATASGTASPQTVTEGTAENPAAEDGDVRDVLPEEVVDAPDAAAPVAAMTEESPKAEEVVAAAPEVALAESEPGAQAAQAEPATEEDVAEVASVAEVADVTEAAPETATETEVVAPVAEAPSAAPEAPAAQGAETAQPQPVRSPTSGALRMPGGDLDALRTQIAQLTQTTELLARHADEEAELGEQRYAVLLEARNRLSAILDAMKAGETAQQGPSDLEEPEPEPEQDYSDLIAIVRQTAENPNHLQYVARLAEHAGELTQALEQLQARKIQPATPSTSTASSAIAALEELRARLDELA